MISSDDESGPKTEIGAFKTETQDDENGTASRNSGKSPILVATDLASRGLDVKDIKWGQLSIASCASFTLQGTNIYISPMEEETHVPNQLDLGKEYVGSQEGMSLMYYTHQFEIEVDWFGGA